VDGKKQLQRVLLRAGERAPLRGWGCHPHGPHLRSAAQLFIVFHTQPASLARCLSLVRGGESASQRAINKNREAAVATIIHLIKCLLRVYAR